ncbi:Metalloprotease [Hypomontagnella monticulosa]|nr:Metalloprotease [Hypomontagnella monticulosa]
MSYPNSSVCLSQPCIQASATLYSRLSSNFQSIDPCTNFEEMVCGGLREHSVIPAWDNRISGATIMQEINQIFLKNVLEAPYVPPSKVPDESTVSEDEKNFKKLVTAYNACLNETVIEAQGVQPLVAFVGNITEMFPIESEGYGNSTKLFGTQHHKAFSNTYSFLAQRGAFPFFQIGVTLDPYNPMYIPLVAPTTVKLLYTNENQKQAYEKIVEQTLAAVLPTNTSKLSPKTLAHNVVTLEQKLAKTAPPSEREDLLEVTTMDNATKFAPEFDFASLFAEITHLPVNRTLYPHPEFSTWLSEELRRTEMSTIQGYFIWQAVQSYATTVEAPELKGLKLLSGGETETVSERWRVCYADTETKMGWLLSKPYIDAKYTDAIDKTLNEMTTRIQNKLASNIDHIDWMTDKVKAIAKKKVEAITPKLGYPTETPNLNDAKALGEYYNTLEVSDSYFNNAVSYAKWATKSMADLIGTERKDGAFPVGSSTSALTVNAFYLAAENSITIFAGTLQQLFMDPNLPAYMNYGALGTAVGHEFTHSLDNNGRLWDEKGAYSDWWDDESEAGFNEKTQCLVKQFDGYTLEFSTGEKGQVNGTQTVSENIADAGGINTAWDAWQDKRRADPASEFDLPGLRDHFTHEQMFFVAAAQFFCTKSNDARKKIDLADVHTPPQVRVGAMMENSEGFRQAFNCPVKEPTCAIY